MRFLATVIGIIAALVMIAVSGSMNFLFMKSLGKTELEGVVLGSASAAADMLKALLPFWIAWAWTARRMMFVGVGSLVFVFFSAFSLLSALGFAADNRGHLAETREGLTATFETVSRDLSEAEARRSGLPKHRPASVVEEALSAIKQDKRFTSSKQCEDATAQASRAFCEGYFSTRAELAAAIEDQRLAGTVERLKSESEKLKEQGAGQDKDPQVSIVSRLFKLDEGMVRNGLVIFAALLVEVGSGLGLFLATSHSEIFKRRRERDDRPAMDARAQTMPHAPPVTPAASAPLLSFNRGRAELSRRYAMEAKPVGDIDQFCLERVHPADDVAVTLPEVYAGYETWCGEMAFAPMERGAFSRAFDDVAQECGIMRAGGQFVGVRIARSEAAASVA